MTQAGEISRILGGERSGNGYRVQSICHSGKKKNLKLWNAPDGKLLAKCFSHGCTFREIMEVLESEGLKEADTLSMPEKKSYAIKKTRLQAQQEMQIDLHVLLLIINDRIASYELQSDSGYMQENPQHVPIPLEPWEREIEVAQKVINNLKLSYGVR